MRRFGSGKVGRKMLIETNLLGTINKVNTAIKRIRTYNPIDLGFDKPYYVCYSGGKDSDCIRILMVLAGVPYDLVHNHTTMDAPETVYYVRSIPGIQITYPDLSIHQLIVKKRMPPTRIQRYCCSYFKEQGGADRFVVTGVRWSESTSRSKRASLEIQSRKMADRINLNSDNSESRLLLEQCTKKGKRVLNPIIDWTDEDVWEFLRYYGYKSNPLYECGYKRIGCVGCPMSTHRKQEFERYPKFKANYIRTFDRMIATYDGTLSWKSGEEVFEWWVNDRIKIPKELENQLSLLED